MELYISNYRRKHEQFLDCGLVLVAGNRKYDVVGVEFRDGWYPTVKITCQTTHKVMPNVFGTISNITKILRSFDTLNESTEMIQ